ncbi:MAG: hypothetical protein Tsb0027_21060 [Wenzhouxiangellaceae bacterium]
MGPKDMTEKRQRGIRASLPRLQQALLAAGLKTQTALAERMADLEGLDNPPRGLVNKMFRGEAVDPASIERVAQALQVESWTLYANSSDLPVSHAAAHPHPAARLAAAQSAVDDSKGIIDPAADADAVSAGPPQRPARLFSRPLIGLGGLLLLVVAVWLGQIWLAQTTPLPAVETASDASASQPGPPPQTASFVMLPALGQAFDLQAHGAMLASALTTHWRQLPAAIAGPEASADAQQIAAAAGVDYVVELRSEARGRWHAVLVNLHQAGAMRSVWHSVYPASASEQRLQDLFGQAAAAIVRRRELPADTREAMRKVMIGRHFLDQARTADHLRRALTEFESAIRVSPEHAPAHAGLCEALVHEHIRSGDTARLDEAAQPCDRALALQPDLPEALVAQAMLDRKRGRHAQAMASAQQALQLAPQHIDALLAAAELQFGSYARGEDPDGLVLALQTLQQAAEIEPGFWKPPYQQARLLYMGGDLAAALQAAGRAAERDANLQVLNNLGTMYFCAGDFAAARDSYLRAGEQDPDSFVGAGQIAVIDYNLGHFAAAVEGFAAAMQRHAESGAAEDHRLWGNYADALRHAGQHAQAGPAYATAIALAERLYHSGDGQPMHAVASLYYRTMLALIDTQQPAPRAADLAALSIQPDNLDAIYQIYLAIVLQHLDDHVRAVELLADAGAGCPGLIISPDIMPIQD